MSNYPVRTMVKPSVLAGQRNGELTCPLIQLPVPQATWPCRLVEPAARAWKALVAAALQEGHVLKPSGPYDSYRPYDVQERIFRQRYLRTNTGNERRTWKGAYWYRKSGVAPAAVPGTSNHGWALAVDVGEERDGDSGTESIDADTVQWLVNNEERYGFSHELQSEPWHIRYFTGDYIPAAVLDYERSLQPVEPIPELGDIMHPLIIKRSSNSKHALLLLEGKLYVAHDGQAEAVKDVGIILVGDKVWAHIIGTLGPVIE